MALGPQAMRSATEEDQREFEALEKQIDDAIQETDSSSGFVTVALGKYLNTRVRTLIDEAYRRVGWNRVSFYRDIRSYYSVTLTRYAGLRPGFLNDLINHVEQGGSK